MENPIVGNIFVQSISDKERVLKIDTFFEVLLFEVIPNPIVTCNLLLANVAPIPVK